MINYQTETLISLNDATKLLPPRRAGKRPHVATLHRWVTAGVKGVRLEVIQIGGTRCTSHEALQRFFERLGTGNTLSSPTFSRQTAIAQAKRELSQAGYA